ncbi:MULTISPECIES: hypothetical protein [Rhodopseudomonas]|uniref:hypothetical protein n=1 Tax=Rhodopseudomonas TaxID=1073 RepID=UPI0011C06395|nr:MULTISPECIES: hypothetical protein [Rhodopseudomonas]
MATKMLDKNERDRRANLTVMQCDGIQPIYVAFYGEAIYYSAERAEAAFARFFDCAKEPQSSSVVVSSVHEALGHAAALSRFFFPVKNETLARARGARLRQLFSIRDDSPLADRELRNSLEHFDERLDEYLLGDIAGYIFPGPMVQDADLADDVLGHIFRLVDPKTETFVLLGRKYSFGPMRNEVERVARLARKMR